MSNNVIAVIPAFNEEKNISKVIADVLPHCRKIIIVNDFSTDQTLKILNNINEEKITVINNEKNLGIGGSMKVGFTKALEYKPEVIIKIDSHLSSCYDKATDALSIGRIHILSFFYLAS